MSFLVRKISRGKWTIGEQPASVNADAITQCLKTDENALSVWKIDSLDDLGKSILAMAAANDYLSKIDVVLLTEEQLRESRITIEETPGITPCKDLASSHRDLSHLNVKDLDAISALIADQIRADQVHTFTLGKLKVILGDAVNSGALLLDELKESVKEKVVKHLEAQVKQG